MVSSRKGMSTRTDLRNARADFSFSATKCLSARTRSRTGAGITVSGATSPRVLGTRYRVAERSDDIASVLAQQADERDQGQADERGRIVRLDPLEQRDPQALDLRASRAVVRGLALEVALDRGIVQRSEAYARRHHPAERDARGGVVHAHRGVEHRF